PSRSLRTLVVARRMVVTAMPDCVYLVSGSSPRLPTRITLLMPRALVLIPCAGPGRIRGREESIAAPPAPPPEGGTLRRDIPQVRADPCARPRVARPWPADRPASVAASLPLPTLRPKAGPRAARSGIRTRSAPRARQAPVRRARQWPAPPPPCLGLPAAGGL